MRIYTAVQLLMHNTCHCCLTCQVFLYCIILMRDVICLCKDFVSDMVNMMCANKWDLCTLYTIAVQFRLKCSILIAFSCIMDIEYYIIYRFCICNSTNLPEPLCFNKVVIVYLSTKIVLRFNSPLPVDRVVFACDNPSLK